MITPQDLGGNNLKHLHIYERTLALISIISSSSVPWPVVIEGFTRLTVSALRAMFTVTGVPHLQALTRTGSTFTRVTVTLTPTKYTVQKYTCMLYHFNNSVNHHFLSGGWQTGDQVFFQDLSVDPV